MLISIARKVGIFNPTEISPVFVVGEEGVRHPNLLCKVPGEREHLVLLGAEVEAVVLPVLVQVHRDGVVHRDLGDGVERSDRQVEAHVEGVACFDDDKFESIRELGRGPENCGTTG